MMIVGIESLATHRSARTSPCAGAGEGGGGGGGAGGGGGGACGEPRVRRGGRVISAPYGYAVRGVARLPYRMELTAAAAALEALTRPCRVVLHTDSEYVRNGITRWHTSWVRRNWRNSTGDPVANMDLWRRLLDASGK